MAFWLKKLLSAWLLPLPLALLALGLGLWWARAEATRSRGLRLAFGGFMLLYVAALPPVAFGILAPLEADMPGYSPDGGPVRAVVALGAGYHPVAGRPLTGQVSSASVTRVAEAIRVLRLHPNARLHCTGWGGEWPGSNAETACALAVALGVEASRTVMHPTPRDTEEEAIAIAAAVPSGRVVVVTHAAHMPRAQALFKRQGVHAVPAPTGHVSAAHTRWTLLPSSRALGTTEGALHEWQGRLWLALKQVVAQ